MPSLSGQNFNPNACEPGVKLPVSAIVISCSAELLGTLVATNAPLMSVGLDSIATTEFTSLLADRLGSKIPATMLFDHPTLDSISRFLFGEFLGKTSQYKLEVCSLLTAKSLLRYKFP